MKKRYWNQKKVLFPSLFCSFVSSWARGTQKFRKWYPWGYNATPKGNNMIPGPKHTCQFSGKSERISIINSSLSASRWPAGGGRRSLRRAIFSGGKKNNVVHCEKSCGKCINLTYNFQCRSIYHYAKYRCWKHVLKTIVFTMINANHRICHWELTSKSWDDLFVSKEVKLQWYNVSLKSARLH